MPRVPASAVVRRAAAPAVGSTATAADLPQGGKFPGGLHGDASSGSSAEGASPWQVSHDVVALAKVDDKIRYGLAKEQERDLQQLARRAFDGGDRPSYVTHREDDRHTSLMRMTEVTCDCIRLDRDLEAEMKERKPLHDHYVRIAHDMAPGIQRVEAMHAALWPFYERRHIGMGIPYRPPRC